MNSTSCEPAGKQRPGRDSLRAKCGFLSDRRAPSTPDDQVSQQNETIRAWRMRCALSRSWFVVIEDGPKTTCW